MSDDWPKDPLIAQAMEAWGARCDEAAATQTMTDTAAETVPSGHRPSRIAGSRAPRRPSRHPRKTAFAALSVLAVVVLAVGIAVRPDRDPGDFDVTVGASGQAGPVGIEPPSPPTTSAFSPSPMVETQREQATRSEAVGATSGPVTDPCGSKPTMVEYALAGDGKPVSVAPGDGGSVWFVDAATPSIGRLDPSGSVTRYVLPVTVHPGAIARGPNGDLWFTDTGRVPGPPGPATTAATPAIGRVTTTGEVRLFPLPTATGNPLGVPDGGSQPFAIVAGLDGAMWFTEAGADQIGRISADGTITEIALPSRSSMHAAPSDIVVGPDGALWFGQALRDSLGRIDPATMAISEFPIAPAGGGGGGLVRANTLAAGPGGALWFEDPRTRTIGRMTTGGRVDALPLPAAASRWPWAVTAGADGNIWFVEGDSARVMRITPAGDVTQFPTLTGLRTATASQLAVASDRAIWFAFGDANRIGRITCSVG